MLVATLDFQFILDVSNIHRYGYFLKDFTTLYYSYIDNLEMPLEDQHNFFSTIVV